MLQTAESSLQACLTEQIDDISTRLILDGVAAITPADFERFAQLAAEAGLARIEAAANQIAAGFLPTLSAPGLTRVVSAGLVELRTLLDAFPSSSESMPTAAPSIPQEASPEIHSPASSNQPLAADEDLIREFITESTDHLVSIESQLLILKRTTLQPRR
jgi:hypothetical protein